ncbi:MAG: ral secretion pathway protein [Rhodospirillales bacterium]|nr:ral secretion pathway protein [Rhodospirillales bacterium]
MTPQPVIQPSLPTGQRGRMLALGITLAVALALWLGIAAPLTGLYADRAETLTQRQILLRHMEQLAATRPALEAQAAVLGTQAPALSGLSGSIPVATAALQGLVQNIASGAGASLTSVESLPGDTKGSSRRVGVKLALSASWPVLVHFLQALEQSGTPMVVDDLQVRGAPLLAQANQQILDAGFSVYAPAGSDQASAAQGVPPTGEAPGTAK